MKKIAQVDKLKWKEKQPRKKFALVEQVTALQKTGGIK